MFGSLAAPVTQSPNIVGRLGSVPDEFGPVPGVDHASFLDRRTAAIGKRLTLRHGKINPTPNLLLPDSFRETSHRDHRGGLGSRYARWRRSVPFSGSNSGSGLHALNLYSRDRQIPNTSACIYGQPSPLGLSPDMITHVLRNGVTPMSRYFTGDTLVFCWRQHAVDRAFCDEILHLRQRRRSDLFSLQ